MSLDGLGAKYLQFFVTNAPLRYTNFNRLIAEGASTFEARCDTDFSITIPNHVTIFTGRPVVQPAGAPNTTQHGITTDFPAAGDTIHNSGNLNVSYKSSFFDVAHDYGLSTAIYLGKMRLQICERSYNVTNGAPDLVSEGGDNGKAKIDGGLTATNSDFSGNSMTNEVNALIQNLTNASPKRYSFIHLAEPDLTGHASGWRSAAWSNMVANIDGQIGRIFAAIDGNPALSNSTAFIVSADHGGGGFVNNGHSEPTYLTNYTIPFFIWGPGIPARTDAYDLFANRGNPGTNLVSYSAVPQPIRNGDSGNLALALLGLPPIPDSFTVPILGATNVQMNVARALDGTDTFWWPASASAFVLESATSLRSPIAWSPITNGIVNNGGMFVYTATNNASAGQFYRLRKL